MRKNMYERVVEDDVKKGSGRNGVDKWCELG